MFLFTIKAKPDPTNEEIEDDVGGAYVKGTNGVRVN